MTKKSIVFGIVFLLCISMISVGFAMSKSDNKKEYAPTVETLKIIAEYDADAKYVGIQNNPDKGFYGCAVFTSDNTEIWFNIEKNQLSGISSKVFSLNDKTIASNEAKEKAEVLVKHAIGEKLKYDCEWKVMDNGVWMVQMTEKKNGQSTGGFAVVVYDKYGNLVSANFETCVERDLELVDEATVIKGAVAGIKSYGIEIDDIADEAKISERLMGGYVYYNVKIDNYIAVVEGWTGDCVFVDITK